MRCLDIAVGLAAGECPLSEGNRTAFCGKCGLSSENIIIVSDEEYATAVPKAGVVDHGASLTSLEQAGDVNVVSINAIPNADASAKFYVINTGSIDAEDVAVTFTGTDGKLETRTLSVPVFNRGTNPIDFVVPIRVRPQRAGDVSVGNFTVSYTPRKGTTRTYMRRVSAIVPPPAEMHVSCELMTFSQKVNQRTFRISNHGGLPGYVRVNLRGDAPQWALSYLPNNGLGAAPANLTQYLIPAGDSLTFQVACTGQANPGRIDVTSDTTNHAITLSYDGVRPKSAPKQTIYTIGIDLGTRQTSAVIRYLPLGQDPPEPVMVDLSKSGQDGEVRVETKIRINNDKSITCGTDFEGIELSVNDDGGLVVHELKSMLFEATYNPDDIDYRRWWDANHERRRFTYRGVQWSSNDAIERLFQGNVTIYEQLMRWTFPYVNWLRNKIKAALAAKTTTLGWPAYDRVSEKILWVFTVPVRDYRINSTGEIPVEYNRYILTLLRVLCRSNWFSRKTAILNARIDDVSEHEDLSSFLNEVEDEFGIRFEVESVAAISGVYNHPSSRNQFTEGLVGRSVYLVDSGGGTTDVVKVNVAMSEHDRKLTIEPVEILGHDTTGKVFGGELISSALIAFTDDSTDFGEVLLDKGIDIKDVSEVSPVRRVFAEDTKKLRPNDLKHDLGKSAIRFTWGTLRSGHSRGATKEWIAALDHPSKFVSSLVPPTQSDDDNRNLHTRMESVADAIQDRYQIGTSISDDYYMLVGGNSKFVPLQSMLKGRFGVAMNELIPTIDEEFDLLRELFVCYGSVFVRDTKSTESYDYPIVLSFQGKQDIEVTPGVNDYEQCIIDANRFSIMLSSRRLGDRVTIDSVSVPVEPNRPFNVDVEATLETICISVDGRRVIEYIA